MTSPDSISLARRFGSVVAIDCTYKTNIFRLPLLHVVGSTCTGRSFTIALAFLHNETYSTYLWALDTLLHVVFEGAGPLTFTTDAEAALIRAINDVFPNSTHLLCRWHILTNLLKHCRPKMKTDENWEKFKKLWNTFVASKNQEDYDTNYKPMSKYAEEFGCLTYIADTWLKQKEKFVAMYTNRNINFGYTVTSRVEGQHRSLKEFLWRGNKDLFGCYQSFKLALDHQSRELNLAIGIEKTKSLAKCPLFFKDLHGVISEYAVSEALKQWELINGGDPTQCSHAFQSTWGIPCRHKLQELRENTDKLSPNEFDLHWHLTLPDTSPESYKKLQERARREFEELVNMPEHALGKVC